MVSFNENNYDNLLSYRFFGGKQHGLEEDFKNREVFFRKIGLE